MSVLTVTKDNFEKEVLKSEVPVLLDFWAAWCSPCRMLAPTIHEIANDIPETEAKIGQINVDEEQELAQAFNIVSIPTLVVMKSGKVLNNVAGVRPKDFILKMLKS